MKIIIGFTAAALCLSMGAVGVFAAPAAATPITEAAATALAEKLVPAESRHLRTERDDAWYEVKFSGDIDGERYEVNVNRLSGKVSSFESKAADTRGGKTATLTEAQAKKLPQDEIKDAKILACSLERDDGLLEYVVTFSTDKLYGEYTIHPGTGKVLEREIHIGTAPAKAVKDGLLSPEKAVESAQKQAPGATVTDIDLERDGGRYFYKIEMERGKTEYDVTLDAKTGEVVWVSPQTGVGPAKGPDTAKTAYIGAEKAKSLVLAKLPGARITQCELDRDDGRAVYEGEAVSGGYEYEFTLDALTGDFLEWDKDYND